MRFRLFVCTLLAVFGLTGCRNPPLNPPRLVLDNEADAAIQLFVQASIMMSRAYHLDPIKYSDFQNLSERAGYRTIPFFPPDTIRASRELEVKLRAGDDSAYVESVVKASGVKPFVKYYIRTGLRAAQLICRSHLTRLDEGSQYVNFLKREIGVASTFASGILALVNANSTLTKSFFIAVTGVNEGFEAYQEYRFLSIDRDAARVLVETAQNKLAEFYLKEADKADLAPRDPLTADIGLGAYTFSDALNAVSIIEYQCTREGMRFLLNRSINNSPSNIGVDQATGTIMFISATDQRNATESNAADPPPKPMTGPSPDAYEKSLGAEQIQRWSLFCGFPAATKLGDNGGALRKAIYEFLGSKITPKFITREAVILLDNRMSRGDTGCTKAS
ncbi:MAG: hypothetical protein HZA66_11030 [Rhodopseudomonas palustris]|uniref:Lipoprotein n=1 Tax=Rhodopseudomonas palustris TaxID=1076 RepID=A0A933W0Z8_RHOPL|nr:hypothetical protein [Rhodopseudomonas palustris]